MDLLTLTKKLIMAGLYVSLESRRISKGEFLVLTYHKISDVPDLADPLKISADIFERQIAFLRRRYRIISGEEVREVLRRRYRFPKKTCVITFDDGWMNNYDRAYPILKKYGVPAIVFLATDYIGTGKMLWQERVWRLCRGAGPEVEEDFLRFLKNELPPGVLLHISELLRYRGNRSSMINELVIDLKCLPVDRIEEILGCLEKMARVHGKGDMMLWWSQVLEMARNGIEFGSHGKSHSILDSLGSTQIREELVGSKKVIEEKLNEPVFLFAYPNGNYNTFVMETAEKAGYHAAFTCRAGMNDFSTNRFELRRKHIRESGSMGLNGKFSELFFKCDLSGIRESLFGWRNRHKY